MDCSLPGSSVHGIFRARILEWVAIAFSRGSFWPRDQTRVSRIVGRCFTVWATRTKLNNKAQSPQLSNLHFYLLLLGSGAGPRVQQDRSLSSTAALPLLLSRSGASDSATPRAAARRASLAQARPTLWPHGPQHARPPWLRRVRLCDPTDRSTPGLPGSGVSDSATPRTAARQASLPSTNSRSPPKPTSIESVMPSTHLILLPSIFSSFRVFSNESVLRIRWP